LLFMVGGLCPSQIYLSPHGAFAF